MFSDLHSETKGEELMVKNLVKNQKGFIVFSANFIIFHHFASFFFFLFFCVKSSLAENGEFMNSNDLNRFIIKKILEDTHQVCQYIKYVNDRRETQSFQPLY